MRGCILCLEAVYYVWRPYTMFGGCINTTFRGCTLRLEAFNYVWRLYTKFGGF
jgi:hypothetical protein